MRGRGYVPDGRCVCLRRGVLGVSFFLGVGDGQGPQEDHHSPHQDSSEGNKPCPETPPKD